MATRLKDTDVVIIGLGAAGGVAVLPLAQAGLEVIGLEAGAWLTQARLRARRNPQQRPRLADGGRRRPSRRAPTVRATRPRRRPCGGRHPMMNAVGGTSLHYWAQQLAAQPVGLQGRQRDDAPLRRVAHPEGLDGRRLAVRLRRARAVLRQDRVRGRRVRPGRQHQRQDRSARQPVRRAAQARAIRCRRCAGRPSTTRWPRRRSRSAGIRFRARRRSTRAPIRTAPAACITASATRAAATSTRRTRPRSRRFRARRRPATSRSSPARTSRRSKWTARAARPASPT